MPITQTYTNTVSSITVITGTVISAQITNSIASQIRSILGQNLQGYGLGTYFTLPVSTSTRVLAVQYNTMLTDLDLVCRHVTGATVTNTLTNLSTFTDHLVISTGTVISATQWQALLNLAEFAEVNRYNLHPSELASDGNCSVIYDQGLSLRTTPFGGTWTSTITQQVRVEWPTASLANYFFNLGSDFVFSPFVKSFGALEPDTAATGTVYGLQTALDTFVSVPIAINGRGSGKGPVYHVNYAQWPYGPVRAPGSSEYFYPQEGGPGVSTNLSLTLADPRIYGTPFQVVGAHYGDYVTELCIGPVQGQSVPTQGLGLRVTLGGNPGVYEVLVPGFLGLYTGPNSPTDQSGWWVYEYDSLTETYVDRQYSWIDIYTGRKGPDPIGLGTAIANRSQSFTLTIVPSDANQGLGTTTALNTVSNAWAQFIDTINTGTAQAYEYNRTQWLDAQWQSTVSVFTSTISTATQIVVQAVRDQATPGQSRIIDFFVTATTTAVGDAMTFIDFATYSAAPGYTTSTVTCDDIILLDNSYDGSGSDYTGGGGRSRFPWWIVGIAIGLPIKIICTRLYELGLLDQEIYQADQAYGQQLQDQDPDAYEGYRYWADWVVSWIDGDQSVLPGVTLSWTQKWARSWAVKIATPWAKEIAHQVGHQGRGSLSGSILLNLGLVLCRSIGQRPKTANPSLLARVSFITAASLARGLVAVTDYDILDKIYHRIRNRHGH